MGKNLIAIIIAAAVAAAVTTLVLKAFGVESAAAIGGGVGIGGATGALITNFRSSKPE